MGSPVSAVRDFWRRKGPKSRLDKLVVYGPILFFFVFMPACTAALVIALPAIDPVDDTSVQFANESGAQIGLIVDGTYTTSIRSGRVKTVVMYDWDRPKLIEAVDGQGKLVFAARVSRTDIEAAGLRMVITDMYPSR